jgi:hypothetical protein
MPKLQLSKDRYFLTIPKNMVINKGWNKGQSLFFVFNERGNIEISDKIRK